MLALALGFVLFAFLGATLDYVEQIAFLFLEELLTIGSLLLSCVRALCPLSTAALSLTLALSLAAAKSTAGGWRGSRRCGSGGDLGHLHKRACFERHHVQVIRAREIDVF